MRTAFEMADFILSREIGPETKFTSVAKAREKRRRYLADLFRPIEQELRNNPGPAPGEGDEVLYAITSRGMGMMGDLGTEYDINTIKGSLNAERDFRMITAPTDSHDVNVAAAFTANRCIITHMSKKVKVPIRVISYDDIIKVESFAGKYGKLGSQYGIINLTTVANDGVGFFTMPMSVKDRDLYREFVPKQACAAVNELLMKYKQSGHAARQAPQAPQASQAAAPAASPAGVGLSPETVEALKRLKELLDAGILTQEEFDANKRHLLGL